MLRGGGPAAVVVVVLSYSANMPHFLPVVNVAQLSNVLLENIFNCGLEDAPRKGVATAGNRKSEFTH